MALMLLRVHPRPDSSGLGIAELASRSLDEEDILNQNFY